MNFNRSKENKWIFQKNISSTKLIKAYVDALDKQYNIISPELIKSELTRNRTYRGRSTIGSTITMDVRLSQMCFYMIGYKKSNLFLPSLTTQLLKENRDIMDKLMLVNLFSIQFPSSYSRTPSNFRIYAGRLIVKLLLDERLNKRLYIDEFAYFLPFVETIDEQKYNELVDDILEFRNFSYQEKKDLIESVDDYESLFANCLHEINYYFVPIFQGFKVLDRVADNGHNEGNIFRFQHGNTTTYRNDAYASRKKVSGYVELCDSVVDAAKLLDENYSAFDLPQAVSDFYTKEDWIRELYEFQMMNYISLACPQNNNEFENLSKTIKDMVYHSKFGTDDGKSFENSLKPVFELFRECRCAELIGGSGDTDLLCTMADGEEYYNVNVDAKKTKNRLNSIPTSRILNHISKHNSKYCIVVSPKFSKGAKTTDIVGHNIVTIEAETLANYCLKECTNSQDGNADYALLNDLINENLGKDITKILNSIIVMKYSMSN